MLYDYNDPNDSFKLARYLLNYDERNAPHIGKQSIEKLLDPASYNNSKIQAEISELIHELKTVEAPGLASFKHYRQSDHKIAEVHEEKAKMLEEHEVYDKYILMVLKEFCIITLMFLIRLEKMHKAGILCGNISPYNFMYNRIKKQCEPCDLSVVLSDKNFMLAEKQAHGDLQYIVVDLAEVPENKYLAPELQQAVHVYNMQRKLKFLLNLADTRNLKVDNLEDANRLLVDFHQKKIKYSNKAEIYSVGYSINQILSHMLQKLAHLGLMLHEHVPGEVPHDTIEQAEALLPHEFENPYQERITELLNEGVRYVYDLMNEHVEQRDSLPESIEKFKSLLKRVSTTKPDSILEQEEEELEELEGAVGLEEHVHAEHEEHGEHEEHEEHGEHDDHPHVVHEEHNVHDDHSHIHVEHEHEHAHDAHEHNEHPHEEHDHGKHDDHPHEAHEEHGVHDDHPHVHEEHVHDDSHGVIGHEGHEAHSHDDHSHDDHGHSDHDDHGHGEHDDHSHDAHDDHSHDEHATHEQHAAHGPHETHENHAAHETHDVHLSHESHDTAAHDTELADTHARNLMDQGKLARRPVKPHDHGGMSHP